MRHDSSPNVTLRHSWRKSDNFSGERCVMRSLRYLPITLAEISWLFVLMNLTERMMDCESLSHHRHCICHIAWRTQARLLLRCGKLRRSLCSCDVRDIFIYSYVTLLALFIGIQNHNIEYRSAPVTYCTPDEPSRIPSRSRIAKPPPLLLHRRQLTTSKQRK
jgi:hypothetical protein